MKPRLPTCLLAALVLSLFAGLNAAAEPAVAPAVVPAVAPAPTPAPATGGPRPAPPFPPRGKVVYSDLCSGPEPWALHGHRVQFVYDEEGYDLIIEFFDKGFDSDILHSPRVIFDRATGKLTFSYADYSDEYLFQGYITSTQLDGMFDDDQQEHVLPRVPNSWPEEPPCQPPSEDDPPLAQ